MSSSGFLNIVYESELDKYITGNPEITYFKKVFRRHSNFSIESMNHSWIGSELTSKAGFINLSDGCPKEVELILRLL